MTTAITSAREPAERHGLPVVGGLLTRHHAPWLVLQVLLGIALAWLAAGRPINHDCAAILQFAQELVEGKLPYIDFVDVNPPLAYYWGALPAYVAKVLNLPIVTVFQVMVGGLVVVTLVELRAVLRRSRLAFAPAELGVVGFAWLAGSYCVLRVGDFGQREHLFILVYTPYLACRMVRYEAGKVPEAGDSPGADEHDRAGGQVPASFAAVLGAQAALGAFFKPTFVAAALAVELLYMLMHRTARQAVRAEVVAVVCVGGAYAVHWLLVPAQMREAFFGRWVPLFLERYGAYGSPTLALHLERALVSDLQYLAPAAAAATLLAAGLAARRRTELRTPLAGLAMLSFMSAAGYVQQYKAWVYHVWPFALAGLMTAAFLVIEARRMLAGRAARRADPDWPGGDRRPASWGGRAFAAVTFALGAFALAVIVRSAATSRVPPWVERTPLVKAIEENTRPGDPVMVVSTSILDAYPMLLQKDRRSGTRYTCMFPLAMTYWDPARPTVRTGMGYRRRDAAPVEEQRFLDELAADVRLRAPKLIAVWAWPGCQGCPLDFVIHDYLTFNGFMAEAIAPGYVDIGQDGPYRFYVPKGTMPRGGMPPGPIPPRPPAPRLPPPPPSPAGSAPPLPPPPARLPPRL